MAYFVTGATGFIGRNLVERLLARPAADAAGGPDIFLLVREQSQERLQGLIDGWDVLVPGSAARIKPVIGDLTQARLGVSDRALFTPRRGLRHERQRRGKQLRERRRDAPRG